MKRNKLLSVLSILLLGLVGCSDDLDKITYNPEDASAGDFENIKGAYVLSKENDEEIIDTFKWGKMEFGYPAAVTYTVQVDLVGNNFENAQSVTATSSLSAELLGKALNTSMVALQKIYKFTHGVAQNVEFRVKGSISEGVDAIYTDSREAKVTSYFTYPKVWVIGDYCGWNHGATQFLYGYNDSKKDFFEAWIDFGGKAANGFKITDTAGWGGGNWGLKEGESYDDEAPQVALYNDGGSNNITIYKKNFYKLGFDKDSETLYHIASMNSFGITGSAVEGKDIAMGFDGVTQEFYVTATFIDGEIYFRADEIDGDLNYGKGASDGQLAKGSAGIAVKAGTYEVRVSINNDQNLYYAFEQGEALDPELIKPAVIEPLEDVEMYVSAKTALAWSEVDFGDQKPAAVEYALELSLIADFSLKEQVLKGKDLKFETTGTDLLSLVQKLDATAVLGEVNTLYWRVVASVMGVDNLYTSEVVSHQVTVKEDPAFPEQLYMIGDEFGNWSWTSEEVVTMNPVNGTPGKFWAIKYIEAGKGFKWNSILDWGGDFSSLGTSHGFEVKDGNAYVAESGLYLIFVDMVNDLISVEAPQIFGMGDAFGGWDEGKYPMTVAGKIASIEVTGNGDLRLYAASTYGTGIDWWRMEFVVRNGVIEYRGNSGDLDPVAVEQGQVVSLDFSTDTGSIE